jgi:hypothetical protein
MGLQTQEGYPLVSGVKPEQETRQVHVFLPKYALQAEGYEAVAFSTAEYAFPHTFSCDVCVWDIKTWTNPIYKVVAIHS